MAKQSKLIIGVVILIAIIGVVLYFVMKKDNDNEDNNTTQSPGSGSGSGSGTTQAPGSGTTQAPGSGTTQAPGSGTTQAPGSGTTQAPAPVSNWTMTDGKAIRGFSSLVEGNFYDDLDIDSCKTKCNRNYNCKGFTYENGTRCYYHRTNDPTHLIDVANSKFYTRDIGNDLQFPGHSGYTVEGNRGMSGTQITIDGSTSHVFDRSTEDVSACTEICNNNPECKGYVFAMDGAEKCWWYGDGVSTFDNLSFTSFIKN
jgi:hypothetical protein